MQKIKATIRYAALDEAEVLQMLPEATANLVDWADFVVMQPASEPTGELAWMRGESDKCGREVRLVRVTTGRVGITSSSSRKLGKYPSELNWSSLGDVLGFLYSTGVRTDQAMLRVATNGK